MTNTVVETTQHATLQAKAICMQYASSIQNHPLCFLCDFWNTKNVFISKLQASFQPAQA